MTSSHAGRVAPHKAHAAHTPKAAEHHSHASLYGPKHSVGQESKAEIVKAERREHHSRHGR